jgi:hypothetical protein
MQSQVAGHAPGRAAGGRRSTRDRGWAINPDGVAYIQDERSFTFTEAGELSCQVAHALLAGDYAAGTKGAVWSNNDVTA